MTAEPFLAACVQMQVGAEKERNFERAEALAARAAERGARLVVLPELFAWRGPPERAAEAAERLDGPTVSALAALARRLGIVLVAGSILERPERPGDLPSNTSVVLDEGGERIGCYRKIHLFDVEIPGAVSVRESERYAPGAEPVCVETSVGRIGLSICYDLRFPELYRELSRLGAEIVCVPSAFTFQTGAAHWELLLRARAVENQCFVLAPDQIGPVRHGPPVYGHSAIVDPWGTVLAMAPEAEAVVLAELDPAWLARVRRELPALAHRRMGR